jgi:hypothetical protein
MLVGSTGGTCEPGNTYQIRLVGSSMGSVSDFINSESEHERALAGFMQWEYIEEQSTGDGFDFIANDNSKIEAKFDWGSIKTGNHFLEYSQTNDNMRTWKPSGHAISAQQADYWVVINEDWLRMYNMEDLNAFVDENRSSFKVKQSRTGINHNRKGQYAKAYLIPFVFLDSIAFLKMPNPVNRKKA